MSEERKTSTSEPDAGSKPPAAVPARMLKLRRILRIAGLLLLATVAVWGYLAIIRPDPLDAVFEDLRREGFTVNEGFAHEVLPGSVLQLADESGPLVRPMVFLRRQDCFPEHEPQESSYSLAERRGGGTGAFKLAASRLRHYLPQVRFDASVARNWSISIDNPRLVTFTRAELSEAFAPACVEAFASALNAGDREDWYAMVMQAVVADSLTLTVDRKSDVGGSVQEPRTVRKSLSPVEEGSVEVEAEEQTVLEAAGPVVLAYATRPIEGVEEGGDD